MRQSISTISEFFDVDADNEAPTLTRLQTEPKTATCRLTLVGKFLSAMKTAPGIHRGFIGELYSNLDTQLILIIGLIPTTKGL